MRIRSMTRCALMAALMALCAWLAVPVGSGAVTLQTLGVFLALGLLGGGKGCLSILIYLGLGAVGLPVFTGFQGGIGTLLSPTGGFLWGFLIAGGLFRLAEKNLPLWINLMLCQLACYLCGGIWYYFAFGGGLWAVILSCVVPYLLPDALKIPLAILLIHKLRPQVKEGIVSH